MTKLVESIIKILNDHSEGVDYSPACALHEASFKTVATKIDSLLTDKNKVGSGITEEMLRRMECNLDQALLDDTGIGGILNIKDTDTCYICGAKQIGGGNSLHCWDVQYECGCGITGAITDGDIFLEKECKSKKK